MADRKPDKPRKLRREKQHTEVISSEEARRRLEALGMDEDGNMPPPEVEQALTDRKAMFRAMSPLNIRRAGIPSEVARQAVVQLRAAGLDIEGIALFLGTTPATLRRYYEDELFIGYQGLTAGIALTLAQQALSGDVKAAMFWLKARAGWNDRPEPKPPEQIDQSDLAEQVKRIVDAVDAIKREAGKLPPPGTPTYEVKE